MQRPIRVRPQPNFRTLNPVLPYGGDPGMDNPAFHPKPKWQTMTVGHWATDQRATKGRVTGDIGYQMATVTVAYGADTTIEAGESILRIGSSEFRPWVDYTPVDGNAGDTAHALAAAISNVPGFSATHLLGVITVRTVTNTLDRIPIEATNWDFAHLTVTGDDTGFLARVTSAGAVRTQAPEFT